MFPLLRSVFRTQLYDKLTTNIQKTSVNVQKSFANMRRFTTEPPKDTNIGQNINPGKKESKIEFQFSFGGEVILGYLACFSYFTYTDGDDAKEEAKIKTTNERELIKAFRNGCSEHIFYNLFISFLWPVAIPYRFVTRFA